MTDEPMLAHIELNDRREHLRITTADDPDFDLCGDARHTVPAELVERLNRAWGEVYEVEGDILRHLLETGQAAPKDMSDYEFRKRASR